VEMVLIFPRPLAPFLHLVDHWELVGVVIAVRVSKMYVSLSLALLVEGPSS
jgi:hypothetical protein